MQTQCISDQLEFEAFDGRRVVAGFDGGLMTSDAGTVLLRETDRVAACFTDGRRQADVVHTMRTLVGQRIVGIALVDELAIDLAWAESEYEVTGKPARRFKEFFYATRDSWSRRRRVIGKAEHLAKGAKPRFIVTSLKRKTIDAKTLYEHLYCARGDMENRIKEQQLDLFADRTSTATLRANQFRLWFSSFAYVLIEALQRIGLGHTEFATATVGTIRLKLFKIGARVTVSVRRIKIAMASACPYQAEFAIAHARLRASPG